MSADRASLAAVHSARSGPRAARTAGSVVSTRRSCPSRAASTWASTAWSRSTPPRRSSPSALPEQLGTVVADAHDGGVERPATEVEHGDGLAGAEPAEAGIVPAAATGSGIELDVADPGDPAGLPQQVELELAPVRRVGQRDGVRPLAGWDSAVVDDVAQELAHERLGAVRGAREHDRRAVAEAPLELAGTGGRWTPCRRSAASPTTSAPSAIATTDGVAMVCVASWSASLPAAVWTAAAVHVVPRSTPSRISPPVVRRRTYGDDQRRASGGFPVGRPKATPEAPFMAVLTRTASSPRDRTNSFG